jgi:hypothetical protein
MSSNPASNTGSLAPGGPAEVVALDDAGRLVASYAGGAFKSSTIPVAVS